MSIIAEQTSLTTTQDDGAGAPPPWADVVLALYVGDNNVATAPVSAILKATESDRPSYSALVRYAYLSARLRNGAPTNVRRVAGSDLRRIGLTYHDETGREIGFGTDEGLTEALTWAAEKNMGRLPLNVDIPYGLMKAEPPATDKKADVRVVEKIKERTDPKEDSTKEKDGFNVAVAKEEEMVGGNRDGGGLFALLFGGKKRRRQPPNRQKEGDGQDDDGLDRQPSRSAPPRSNDANIVSFLLRGFDKTYPANQKSDATKRSTNSRKKLLPTKAHVLPLAAGDGAASTAGAKQQAMHSQPERCDDDQRRRNILGIIGEHRSVTLAPWKDAQGKTAGAGGSSSFDDRFVHRTHVCDGCEMRPIVGYRYHAVNAHDVDFCESCYVQASNYRGPLLWGENFSAAKEGEVSSSEEKSGDDGKRGGLVFQLAQENINYQPPNNGKRKQRERAIPGLMWSLREVDYIARDILTLGRLLLAATTAKTRGGKKGALLPVPPPQPTTVSALPRESEKLREQQRQQQPLIVSDFLL